MADNITLNEGSGGSALATDDISSVHYQKMLIGYGDDGTWTRVTATVGFPIVAQTGATFSVTNAGTFATQVDGSALTALQLIDDVVYADDADWTDGASKHALVGGLYQSSPQTITDGDVGPLEVTQNGYLIVSVNGTATVDCNSSDVTVDGMPTDTFVAEDGALGKGVLIQGDDGTDRHNVAVDTSGNVQIDIAADSSGMLQAEDGQHSSGHKGIMPLAVRNDDLAALAGTDGDYAPVQVDAEGALFVNPAAAEPKRDSGVAAGNGADTMVGAVASRTLRVLALGLFATSATVNNCYVDNDDNALLFNAANPLPLSLDADADTVPGFVLPYNPGGWFETDTANEAITLTSDAAQDIAWTITYIEVA